MAVLEANRVADSGGATLTVPPGTLIFHCANSAPSGFLKANGAALNTTTYAALFAAIGYTFGGSGASFNVPDMRGEFPRGWDDARGVDVGRGFGTFQNLSTEQHKHATSTGFDPQPRTFSWEDASGNPVFGSGVVIGNTAITAAGGRFFGTPIRYAFTEFFSQTSGETRPRNIALLACIKF
jgi:microcystin-dependent protein